MRKSACLAMIALSAATAAGAQNSGPSKPYPFTAQYFVGEWVDGEDCSVPRLKMHADGTFTSVNGGKGRWSLDGNRLTFGGGANASTFTVAPVDQRRVYLYYDDGGSGYSLRC